MLQRCEDKAGKEWEEVSQPLFPSIHSSPTAASHSLDPIRSQTADQKPEIQLARVNLAGQRAEKSGEWVWERLKDN